MDTRTNYKEVAMSKEPEPKFWDHILKFVLIMAFLMTVGLIIGILKDEKDERMENGLLHDVDHRYSIDFGDYC